MARQQVESSWAKPLALLLLLVAQASVAQPLPPAPAPSATPEHLVFEASDSLEPVLLNLELVVNTVTTGKIVAVENRRGELFMHASDLVAAGIQLPGGTQGDSARVNLNGIADLRAHYDVNRLQLQIVVPPEWLPAQDIRRRTGDPPVPQDSFGALLNYDFYYDGGTRGPGIAALWTEQRLFDGFGVISNTGVVRHVLDYSTFSGGGSSDGYIRQDTTWTWSQEDRILTWTAGDSITGSQSWSNSVRMGGIKLARDFRIRPDLITYPLPQFASQTAVPTTVDVFVNGNRVSRDDVRPGPFIISDFPFISGAGEATVVTTDALGRQTQTTMPFYVTSEVLRKGLFDFSTSVGAVREDYGVKNFSYGEIGGTGSFRYGVSDAFTLESQVELSDSLAMVGAGGVGKLWQYGVLSTAALHSNDGPGGGWQWTYGYRYGGKFLSFSYQGTRRDSDFQDLALHSSDRQRGDARDNRLSSDVFTASVLLGRTGGTVGAGFFDIDSGDNERTQLLNLSYNKPVWRDCNVFVGYSRDLGRKDDTFIVQVVMPFEHMGHASATVIANGAGRTTERISYSRNAPSSGGVGWEVGYSGRDGAQDIDAAGSLNTHYAYLDGGMYSVSGKVAGWAGAHGSLLLMDKSLFPARQVNDGFVLVSTDGVADVPVYFENQLVGDTDSSGHLLVPWVPSYYAGKYEVDPLVLPGNMRTPLVEQRIAVRRGSGAVLRFPIAEVQAALITLVDAENQPLPVGSAAQETTKGLHAQVGFDGEVYFEGLGTDNVLDVTRPDGGHCTSRFTLPDKLKEIARVGPLHCE